MHRILPGYYVRVMDNVLSLMICHTRRHTHAQAKAISRNRAKAIHVTPFTKTDQNITSTEIQIMP